MYQKITPTFQGAQEVVRRIADNACIPFDPANIDYQEYLKWLALGNQPLPPDEPPTV